MGTVTAEQGGAIRGLRYIGASCATRVDTSVHRCLSTRTPLRPSGHLPTIGLFRGSGWVCRCPCENFLQRPGFHPWPLSFLQCVVQVLAEDVLAPFVFHLLTTNPEAAASFSPGLLHFRFALRSGLVSVLICVNTLRLNLSRVSEGGSLAGSIDVVR